MAKKNLQYPGEICRPTEHIVGRVEFGIFEPAPLPPVELRSVKVLEKLIRPMTAPPQPRKGDVPSSVVPQLVQEIKNSRYKNFNIDTSLVVADHPIGLKTMGIVADTMTIIAVGAGGLSYKLNSPSNDVTPVLAVGQEETDFEIEEIYITTTGVGVGTAIIRINWNPDIIRIKP